MKMKKITIMLLIISVIVLSFSVITIYSDDLITNFLRKDTTDIIEGNVVDTYSGEKKDWKLIDKGENVSEQFKNSTVLKEKYGEEVGFAIEDVTGESDGSPRYALPNSITVGTNGKIYISNPVSKNIKVFDDSGKIKDTIFFDEKETTEFAFLKDIGIDKNDNIFIRGQNSLYKFSVKERKFEKLVDWLGTQWNFNVLPEGRISSVDLSDGNLRSIKFDAEGKVLEEKKQFGHSAALLSYEDFYGKTIDVDLLGGSIMGVQYLIGRNGSDEKFIYQPYLYENYYYVETYCVGCDRYGNMYWERAISPDGVEIKEDDDPTEYWIDIINIDEQTVETFKLDKSNSKGKDNASFYGGQFASKNTISVDQYGNVYQLNANSKNVSVTKYER